MSAVPAGGRMWSALERAQRGETTPLNKLLHISRQWGAAGFDVLGLDLVDGAPEPVRYEVKGIPAEPGRLRIFLSRNELAVARRIGRPDAAPCQRRGSCVLPKEGFRPDGLEVTIEMGG